MQPYNNTDKATVRKFSCFILSDQEKILESTLS